MIWGAGDLGTEVLSYYQNDVAYFIDNNPQKQGKFVDGILVKTFSDFLAEKDRYILLIAIRHQGKLLEDYLEEMGVENWFDAVYHNKVLMNKYVLGRGLIENPYKDENFGAMNEYEWNQKNESRIKKVRLEINENVKKISCISPMFRYIEIETINRCNGNCAFCPVNANRDKREYHIMKDELFEKIVLDLEKLKYHGQISLFSNNEPFLDKKIIDRHELLREKCPEAFVQLLTNGTLLTVEHMLKIMPFLDQLTIDNYNQELVLNPPVREIKKYIELHPELSCKVKIILRRPKDVLTSRGGDSPNRNMKRSYPEDTCILPWRQLIVRPDGKVSLCCNDPLGKYTMGDLSKEDILSVWHGRKFNDLRKALAMGRSHVEHCLYCDTFYSI